MKGLERVSNDRAKGISPCRGGGGGGGEAHGYISQNNVVHYKGS